MTEPDYKGEAHRDHFEMSQALLGNKAFIDRMQGFESPRVTLKCQRGHRLFSIEIVQHGGSMGMAGRQRLDITTRDREYYAPDEEISKRADPQAERSPFQNAICGRPGCSNQPPENRATCEDHGALMSNAVAAIRQRFTCPTCAKQGRKTDIVLRQASLLKLYGAAVVTGKSSIQLHGDYRL